MLATGFLFLGTGRNSPLHWFVLGFFREVFTSLWLPMVSVRLRKKFCRVASCPLPFDPLQKPIFQHLQPFKTSRVLVSMCSKKSRHKKIKQISQQLPLLYLCLNNMALSKVVSPWARCTSTTAGCEGLTTQDADGLGSTGRGTKLLNAWTVTGCRFTIRMGLVKTSLGGRWYTKYFRSHLRLLQAKMVSDISDILTWTMGFQDSSHLQTQVKKSSMVGHGGG